MEAVVSELASALGAEKVIRMPRLVQSRNAFLCRAKNVLEKKMLKMFWKNVPKSLTSAATGTLRGAASVQKWTVVRPPSESLGKQVKLVVNNFLFPFLCCCWRETKNKPVNVSPATAAASKVPRHGHPFVSVHRFLFIENFFDIARHRPRKWRDQRQD